MTHQLISLLSGNEELYPLLKKVHEINELQHHFISVAPAYLSQSSQVLGLHRGTLTLAVANATFAAKLRQLAPELVALLRDRGCEISGIRVKVQVSYSLNRPKHAPRRLGSTALNALDELNRKLPDDSMLKLALAKMARFKD
jgi:hypothetical protein